MSSSWLVLPPRARFPWSGRLEYNSESDAESSTSDGANEIDSDVGEELEMACENAPEETGSIHDLASSEGSSASALSEEAVFPVEHHVNEFRAFFWNCNSIALKGSESLNSPSRLKLELLMRWMKRDNPDVVVLVDTRATAANVVNLALIVRQRFKGVYRIQSVPVPQEGSVGGQIIIYSHRLKSVQFKEVVALGSLTRLEFGFGGTKMTVMGTYWPVRSGTANGLDQQLRRSGLDNPLDQLKAHIKQQVNMANADERLLVVGGDFNTDIWRTDVHKLSTLLEEVFIADTSTVAEAATYCRGNKHSCIDYVLATPGIRTLNSFPYDVKGIFADHAPMFFRALISGRAQVDVKRPLALRLRSDVDRKDQRRVDKIKERYALLTELDSAGLSSAEYLRVLGEESANIVSDICRKRHHPNGWSPHVHALILALEYMCRMKVISMRIHNQRGPRLPYAKQVGDMRKEWSSKLASLGRTGVGAITASELRAYGPYSYDMWQGVTEEEMLLIVNEGIKETRRLVHGRYRKDERKMISANVARRQKLFEANCIKRVLTSINGTRREGYTMETVTVEGEVVADPVAIAQLSTDFFRDWFRDKRTDPCTPVNEEWKWWESWGDPSLANFSARFAEKGIPPAIQSADKEEIGIPSAR